jgi:hypothetical protein
MMTLLIAFNSSNRVSSSKDDGFTAQVWWCQRQSLDEKTIEPSEEVLYDIKFRGLQNMEFEYGGSVVFHCDPIRVGFCTGCANDLWAFEFKV